MLCRFICITSRRFSHRLARSGPVSGVTLRCSVACYGAGPVTVSGMWWWCVVCRISYVSSRRSSHRFALFPPSVSSHCETFTTSMWRSVGSLFSILHPNTCLAPSITAPNSTQPYALRTKAHNRTLPQRKSHLVDCNFIIRMLYWNAYWQSF